jgi:methionyl-tRNA synthetase
MRDVSMASDGDFSRKNLITRYNNDLGNDLGNLLNRVVSMIGRYREGQVPEAGEAGDLERELRAVAEDSLKRAAALIEIWDLDDALEAIWGLVRRGNQYLEERQPWRLAKDPAATATLDTTLWSAAEATRLAAVMLAPFIPASSSRILAQLGLRPLEDGDWQARGRWGTEAMTTVSEPTPLFPRIDVEV